MWKKQMKGRGRKGQDGGSRGATRKQNEGLDNSGSMIRCFANC